MPTTQDTCFQHQPHCACHRQDPLVPCMKRADDGGWGGLVRYTKGWRVVFWLRLTADRRCLPASCLSEPHSSGSSGAVLSGWTLLARSYSCIHVVLVPFVASRSNGLVGSKTRAAVIRSFSFFSSSRRLGELADEFPFMLICRRRCAVVPRSTRRFFSDPSPRQKNGSGEKMTCSAVNYGSARLRVEGVRVLTSTLGTC